MTNPDVTPHPKEARRTRSPTAAPARARGHRINLVQALAELTRNLNLRNTPMEQVATLRISQHPQGWLATLTFQDGSSVDWALSYIPEAHATSFSLPLPPPDTDRQPRQGASTTDDEQQHLI